jgi:hypothetical protein
MHIADFDYFYAMADKVETMTVGAMIFNAPQYRYTCM